jgi:RHS repeat-associated protein
MSSGTAPNVVSATWYYDIVGNVIQEQRTIAGVTKNIYYTYNGDNSLASITYPSGRKVSYSVGNAERPTSLIDSSGINYVVGASYAATGALAGAIYGQTTGFNGFNASRTYDSRLDLTSIAVTSSAGTAISLGYCFYQWSSGACQATGSNNGNLTSIANNVDTGRTQTFGYDSLSRLSSATTQATSGADCWGQGFVVDPLANLTTITSTQTGCSIATLSATASATTNRLGFTPAPSYDPAGNMLNDGSYAYTFDAENRISSGNAVTYTYDGTGMRVQKSSGTLYWRAITGDVLAETDASGNMKNEYIYFAGQRVAWWDSLGNSYYINADSLGTTRTITKSNGTVCYDADFTPYGQELIHTNNCASTYNYKFTGYERDSETGLDYAFARYYSSRLARFMSADPSGGSSSDPQSLNRYAYVGNSAPNFSDPSGRLKFPCPGSGGLCTSGDDNCNVDGAGAFCGQMYMNMLAGLLQTSYTFWAPDGNINWYNFSLSDLLDESNGGGEIVLAGISIYDGSDIFGSGTPSSGTLRTALRNILRNPKCAALLGGSDKANQAVDHLLGQINVDSPGYSGNTQAKADIDSGTAWAETPVPAAGNFQGGQWTGPNFSTYIGSTVAAFSLSQQLTVEMHELIHATSPGGLISQGLVDLSNPFGQLANVYQIHKDCDTALPPKY